MKGGPYSCVNNEKKKKDWYDRKWFRKPFPFQHKWLIALMRIVCIALVGTNHIGDNLLRSSLQICFHYMWLHVHVCARVSQEKWDTDTVCTRHVYCMHVAWKILYIVVEGEILYWHACLEVAVYMFMQCLYVTCSELIQRNLTAIGPTYHWSVIEMFTYIWSAQNILQ